MAEKFLNLPHIHAGIKEMGDFARLSYACSGGVQKTHHRLGRTMVGILHAKKEQAKKG